MAMYFQKNPYDHLYSSISLSASEPFTLACWFKPDNLGTHAGVTLAYQPSQVQGYGLQFINITVNYPVQAKKSLSLGTNNAAGYNSYVANTWQHGAAVFTGDTYRQVYYNGNAGNAGTVNVPDPTAVSWYTIGYNAFSGNINMKGAIAEVGVWTRALSSDEIGALADGCTPLSFETNLVSYVPLYDDFYDVVREVYMSEYGDVYQVAHPTGIHDCGDVYGPKIQII